MSGRENSELVFEREVSIAKVASYGILLGGILVFLGIITALFNPSIHISFLLIGVSLTFAGSVYNVYVSSMKGGRPRKGFEALLSIVLESLLVVAPFVFILSRIVGLSMIVLAMVLFNLHLYVQSRGTNWSKWYPMYAYPILMPLIITLYSIIYWPGVFQYALLLAFSMPVPMITTVSFFSTARNYNVSPKGVRVLAPYLTYLVGTISFIAGLEFSLIILSLGLVVHYISIGLMNFGVFLERAKKIGGHMVRASQYIILGHFLGFVGAIVLLLGSIFYFNMGFPLLLFIHGVFVFFIGTHIFVHAALMLSLITPLNVTRRFNKLNIILLFIAGMLRLTGMLPHLTVTLFIISLLLLAMEFKDYRKLRELAPIEKFFQSMMG